MTGVHPVGPAGPALTVAGGHARHGDGVVLTDIALTVPAGALVSVLGPSGCGKTTLLRIIAGFHRPAQGSVILGGRTLDGPGRHVRAERRRVGYIPQEVALFPHLSVTGNVRFGLPRTHAPKRVGELLELCGLQGLAGRHPHQLSGGQQQRVALARALAAEPDILLLDEPFSALDASLRARVRVDVADLLRDTGTPAILVTHDAQEAMDFADQIAVMDAGRILQTGTPEHLYALPATAGVARSLGEANLLHAVMDTTLADTPLGRIPVLPTHRVAAGGRGTVVIRPSQLRITTSEASNASATVIRCGYVGTNYRLEVRVPDHDPSIIVYSSRPYPDGRKVGLAVTGPAAIVADEP